MDERFNGIGVFSANPMLILRHRRCWDQLLTSQRCVQTLQGGGAETGTGTPLLTLDVISPAAEETRDLHKQL